MFHPNSNRLASFLEISALSIALAQSGGAQYKAGYLRIEAVAMNATGSSFVSSIFSSSKEKEEKGAIPFGRKSERVLIHVVVHCHAPESPRLI